MKATLSAITTSAGLLFLMWLFFYFPTFHGEDVRFRLGAAAMGMTCAMMAFRSGKLRSRLEFCTLAGSASIGVLVVVAGLMADFL